VVQCCPLKIGTSHLFLIQLETKVHAASPPAVCQKKMNGKMTIISKSFSTLHIMQQNIISSSQILKTCINCWIFWQRTKCKTLQGGQSTTALHYYTSCGNHRKSTLRVTRYTNLTTADGRYQKGNNQLCANDTIMNHLPVFLQSLLNLSLVDTEQNIQQLSDPSFDTYCHISKMITDLNSIGHTCLSHSSILIWRRKVMNLSDIL